MSFSVSDYVLPLLVFPAAVFICLFFVAFLFGRALSSKYRGTAIAVIPILLWLLTFFVWMVPNIDSLTYPLSLLFLHHKTEQHTAGQITEMFSPAASYPSEGDSNIIKPVHITVNDNTYYVLKCDLDVGDWVSIKWTTDRRVVTKIEKITEECAKRITDDNETVSQDLPQEPKAHAAGTVLRMVSLVIFCTVLVCYFCFGRIISSFMHKKDSSFCGRIVPNRLGIISALTILIPGFGLLIGMSIGGFRGVNLIIIIAGVAMLHLLIKKQTTWAELTEEYFVVCEKKRMRYYQFQEIVSVSWGYSRIPHVRSLEIVLRNGVKLVFAQEDFWGITNMYNKLNEILNSRKE